MGRVVVKAKLKILDGLFGGAECEIALPHDGFTQENIMRAVRILVTATMARQPDNEGEVDGSGYMMQAWVDDGVDIAFIIRASDLVTVFIVGIVEKILASTGGDDGQKKN